MEDRRFDELTRTLGAATSRRGVLKGLLGGLAAGLLGRVTTAGAAGWKGGEGQACDTKKEQDCLNQASNNRTVTLEACNENDSAFAKAVCKLAVQARYDYQVSQCRSEQCPPDQICVNGHCCHDQTCCSGGTICHPALSTLDTPIADYCCATGDTCCGSECCPADKTCCSHYDGSSVSYSCSELQSDPKNCGRCGNECDAHLQCIEGACTCPSPQTVCSGPLNALCCSPGEYCQGTAFGFVTCAQRCIDPCEVWDASSQSCQPKECASACEYCDSSSGSAQCVPVPDGIACGSNLVCCQGECKASCGCQDQPNGTSCDTDKVCCNGDCVSNDCPPGQQFNTSTCQCECTTGETCGPFCCSSNKVCCPDTVSGMSCRDPDPICSGCSYSCGDTCCDQYQFCCRAADYSYHCVANSGDSC